MAVVTQIPISTSQVRERKPFAPWLLSRLGPANLFYYRWPWTSRLPPNAVPSVEAAPYGRTKRPSWKAKFEDNKGYLVFGQEHWAASYSISPASLRHGAYFRARTGLDYSVSGVGELAHAEALFDTADSFADVAALPAGFGRDEAGNAYSISCLQGRPLSLFGAGAPSITPLQKFGIAASSVSALASLHTMGFSPGNISVSDVSVAGSRAYHAMPSKIESLFPEGESKRMALEGALTARDFAKFAGRRHLLRLCHIYYSFSPATRSAVDENKAKGSSPVRFLADKALRYWRL